VSAEDRRVGHPTGRLRSLIALCGLVDIVIWAIAAASLLASLVVSHAGTTWRVLLVISLVLILVLAGVRRHRRRRGDRVDGR
jgi:membrane protein implicated in regulation of membrane protease activity